MTKPLKGLLAGLFTASLCLAASPAAAQTADFSGKTIEWIIPFATGGGSDVWARYNAPFFARHLPGNPTVVVRNQPGGGSTTGTNMFTERARPDGLTILGTSGSTQFPYLLGDPRAKYEYKDWEIVLATPTGGVVYTSPEFGSVKGLKDKKLRYASQGATSLDLVPMLAFKLLGLDVQHVFGFKGRGEGRLAFERGETQIDYQTSSAYKRNVVPLIQDNKAVPLFSFGALDSNGNIVRDPSFPDIPSFLEVYREVNGKDPSGELWEAYKAFFVAGFAAQKMVFLPKGTSPEIVAAWREAAAKMVKDPEFIQTKAGSMGEDNHAIGPEALVLFEAATTISPQAKAYVVDMLTKEYNVKLTQ
jgi:tripartite-type tricarboxylate transporter receptor subunit TctC